MKKIFLTIILLALVVFAINAQDISQGLVAHYPLDGNANDAVGSLDGTLTSVTTMADRNGTAGGALYFDDSPSYVTIPDATGAFEFQESGYSVSAWIYVPGIQDNIAKRIISYGGKGVNGWEIHTNNWPNTIDAVLCDDATTYHSASILISKGYWQHMVITYQTGVTNFYINGILEATNVYTYNENDSDLPLVFGAKAGNQSWGFEGGLDEVRFYNRLITQAEIDLLAENGASFLSNFENNSIVANGGSVASATDLYNGGTVTAVTNPEKDAVNSSDYVCKITTIDNADYSRAEYSTQWDNTFKTNGYTHIYKWKVYFPTGYTDVDAISYDWDVIAQFVTDPCANYDNPDPDGYTYFGDEICGTGGIFNELRIDKDDFSKYGFTFRAEPSCDTIQWTYPEDEWVNIVLEIYYSTNFDGYYGVYINGNLLGGESGVRTLPESFIDDNPESCDIRWKVGAYTNWTDAIKTERSYYIDDLELYIDKDIADICPECSSDPVVNTVVISDSGTEVSRHEVAGVIYDDKVIVTGEYVDIHHCEFNNGVEIRGDDVSIYENTFFTDTDTAMIIIQSEDISIYNNSISGTGYVAYYEPSMTDYYHETITINNNTYSVPSGIFNGTSWGIWRRRYKFDLTSTFNN